METQVQKYKYKNPNTEIPEGAALHEVDDTELKSTIMEIQTQIYKYKQNKYRNT